MYDRNIGERGRVQVLQCQTALAPRDCNMRSNAGSSHEVSGLQIQEGSERNQNCTAALVQCTPASPSTWPSVKPTASQRSSILPLGESALLCASVAFHRHHRIHKHTAQASARPWPPARDVTPPFSGVRPLIPCVDLIQSDEAD